MNRNDEKNKLLCNNCDKCCRYIALEIDKPTTQHEYDQVRWFLLHNHIMVFIDEGKWYLYISGVECSNLGKDGLCNDYQNRPQVCRNYDQKDCDRSDDVKFYDVLFRDENDFLKWLKKHNKKIKTHNMFK